MLPIWWPEYLARAKTYPYLWFLDNGVRHFNYPAFLALFCAVSLFVSQAADKTLMTREFKGFVSDREFIEAYAGAVESCIKTMHAASGMNEDQLKHARKQILHAIRLVVHHYYDKAEKLDINACYMAAYPIADVPDGIEGRLKFRDKKRLLATYGYVLDLVMWADDHGDLPCDFAIPVEDEKSSNFSLRLLPGAPSAFVKNIVCVVEDTRKISSYFETEGRYVDREVVAEELEFFKTQRFRSFASLPLQDEGEKKGVLNLQSGKVNIFGRKNRDQAVVTKLLHPLQTALYELI